MKKRKLLFLVTVCFVVLYFLSALTFAFMSWNLSEQDEHRVGNSYSLQMQEDLHSFSKNHEDGQMYTSKDFEEFVFDMHYLYGAKYPTLFALIDNETNEVVVRSKNIVRFYNDATHEFIYVDLDPYLTKEKREEFLSIQKEVNNTYNVSKISFAVDGDNFIPVEMTVATPKMEDYKTIKLTDYTSNLIVDENRQFRFYNLETKGYTANMYKLMELQLEDRINKMISSPIQLSGNSSYLGIGNRGYNSTVECGSIDIGSKTYTYIFIGPAYNEYVETFTNEYFVASMVLQGILFAIAYLIALRVATKLYKKNEQMTKSQRAFTSAAAHELKTPLAVIQNQCECIIENVAPEKNGDYIKSVYDETVRMNGIVTSFMQYNRLVNTEKLQKEKCDLKEIVLTETEKYKAFAETKGVTMEVNIGTDKCEINCNRDLISMAVDNYLSNAIKYATGEKKVVVTLDEKNFSVYNTSEGIPEEIKKYLWNILSRGSAARTKDGNSTGMGLPICAEIFKAHGYDYGYRNLNGGVEFYFDIK